jgi:hypothetical protein
VTVPDTPVSIRAEVWNGEWAPGTEYQVVFFDAVVSARVSAEVGQNAVDWQFVESTKQVRLGDTLVSIGFEPVRMPDGVPQIQFEDGSLPIGLSGQPYYPTLLEATINVSRPAIDPARMAPVARRPKARLRRGTGERPVAADRAALVGLVARRAGGRSSSHLENQAGAPWE